MVYIGKGTVDWRKEHKEEYDYIYVYLIDFNFLLQNYMDSNENYVLSLCKSINELIEK